MSISICTPSTSSLDLAYIQYLPSVPGNAFLVAWFASLLLVQIVTLVLYRTWGFSTAMICGLILEVIGYVGRIQLHCNPFGYTEFLIISHFRPRTYTTIFVTCDVISLILQAAGAAITSGATDNDIRTEGINIMIAGLAFQVGALGLFIALGLEYTVRSMMQPRGPRTVRLLSPGELEGAAITSTWKWKLFLICIPVAAITIFVRSFFRVFELNGGFHSDLANNEPALMVLDGVMTAIACFCLTISHPGFVMGSRWNTVKSASG
ncbi:unnamed protein product [Penicillium salamii]|uniref:RTA-like protein n=1 Tax=Penicillium salamii TaxID=1612424 RepID=A0A9W4IRY0_9EURO|nr:unnamed protein product [Penicillium salamii]